MVFFEKITQSIIGYCISPWNSTVTPISHGIFVLENSKEDNCEKVQNMAFFMPEGQNFNKYFDFYGDLSSFFRFQNRHKSNFILSGF